jgi:hypothetical protein
MNIVFIFEIMNPLCCNENSGVSLSDLKILKLSHEFRKFISQPFQPQLAHIIEIIYSKEVLLQYESIKSWRKPMLKPGRGVSVTRGVSLIWQ